MIEYPYMPAGRQFRYVRIGDPYMRLAESVARTQSQDLKQKVACVVVHDGVVVGWGANGSTYHVEHGCRRKELGCKTGEGYELCEGCHPKNHAEPSAIRHAIKVADARPTLLDADVYMWGHWWCCEPCWRLMLNVGVRNVYLLEGSERLFNAAHEEYMFR